MRIAVLARAVFPLHGVGGLERHVRDLTRHLVQAGIDVTLFTPPAQTNERRDRVTFERARLVEVSARSVPWPARPGFIILDRSTNYLAWSVKAARRILDERFDVVHAEGGAGFGYAFARGSDSPPLVIQLHGLEEFKGPWLKRTAYAPLRWATRYAAKRAERVLIPDRSRVSEVERFLSVQSPRAVVSPNAIDLAEVDRPVDVALVEPLGLAEGAAVLLSVGRLEENKGFHVLVDALAMMAGEPAWTWVLVGKGSEESSLRERVRWARLDARVRFAGAVGDDVLAALYRRCTLFVHPTLYEGSSLVTLEAMARRKPVVASAVGGIPDKIEDGENGFLVPPSDPLALASALRRALALGGGLQAMGEKGRARVETEFSWAEKTRSLISLYEQLVSRS